MIIRKGYKYRLKLQEDAIALATRFAGCKRFVWNKALGLQLRRLEGGIPVMSYADLCGLLKLWKQSEEYGFLAEVHSQVLQQGLKDLDRALWDGLTKKKDMPRFKKKGRDDSFRYPQGFRVDGNRIYLPKIGWVGFRRSRRIAGLPCNATVSRQGKHWFVSVQTEREVENPVHPSMTAAGGDMGIARFLTLSDGTVFEPLNSFRRLEGTLAKLQAKLSRRVRFSANWRRQKEKVSRLHRKIADARNDYLHKVSTAVSKSHALVVLEDLQVRNMSASARGTLEEPGRNVRAKSGLNKSILDQGWYEFRRQLDYKLFWRGGMLLLVPPRYSSQTCPVCGCVSSENRPTQPVFRCVRCKYQNHADLVAAMNILAAGQAVSACGSSPVGGGKQELAGRGDPVPLQVSA